ncbi:MAG: IS1634 family transposase [Candidatus Electrothrix gigas]
MNEKEGEILLPNTGLKLRQKRRDKGKRHNLDDNTDFSNRSNLKRRDSCVQNFSLRYFHIEKKLRSESLIEGNSAILLQERIRLLERKSCFILATNQLDCEELSDTELLEVYKDQQKVERGFRFLKDPMFMASTLFLKSPKRIMALMMVMTLCLLVYAALEHRIRKALDINNETFPNQKGKPVSNPTARWVFQFFSGIYLLIIGNTQQVVLNLNEHHMRLLKLLGRRYEKLYSGNG